MAVAVIITLAINIIIAIAIAVVHGIGRARWGGSDGSDRGGGSAEEQGFSRRGKRGSGVALGVGAKIVQHGREGEAAASTAGREASLRILIDGGPCVDTGFIGLVCFLRL